LEKKEEEYLYRKVLVKRKGKIILIGGET